MLCNRVGAGHQVSRKKSITKVNDSMLLALQGVGECQFFRKKCVVTHEWPLSLFYHTDVLSRYLINCITYSQSLF